jgi:hypothetical protein
VITAQSGQTLDLRGQWLQQVPGENAIITVVDCWNTTIIGGQLDSSNDPGHDGNWDTHMGYHQIRVIGGGNIKILEVGHSYPISDAIYVDGGTDGLLIQHCKAKGNGTNRQFISIIHCWNFQILDNYSENMSRPDQPGHIDLEPDEPWQAVWNGHVERNTMIGGNARGIQCYNEIAKTGQFGEITIRKNVIRGVRDIGIALQGSSVVTEGRVVLEDNTISDARTPTYISNWENVQIVKDHDKKRRRRKH